MSTYPKKDLAVRKKSEERRGALRAVAENFPATAGAGELTLCSGATAEGGGGNWERQGAPSAGRAGLSKVLNKARAFDIIFSACVSYSFRNVFWAAQ